MKKIWILLVLTSIILVGCGDKDEMSTDKGLNTVEALENIGEQKVVYVKAQAIGTMDFENHLSLPATLEPKEKVMISSKINGSIENIFVDIGGKIKKEEKLCKIDDTIYRIQFAKANTAVKSAENTLRNLKDFKEKDGMEYQGIEVAQSQYDTAEINHANIEKTYNRMKNLYSEKAISQSDYENIKGQFDLAKSQLDLALTNLNQAKRNWQYNVESAEIGLEAVQNDYKLAKENLEYTDILAPISGVVSEKSISIGENVGPGAVLFTIVNTDIMYADSGVSEKDIAKIKEGQRVLIKIDSLGKKIMEGKVETISPVINEQSKTYPIKVLIENTDNELKGGMFATIEIVVDSHKNALSVPKDAVFNENGDHYVFIEEGGKAEKRLVKLGFTKDDYYEILEGVQRGEKVIKSFNDKLKDGSSIKAN